MDVARHALAFVVVAGFLGLVYAQAYFKWQVDAGLLGTLGSGGFMVIISYYFGSSASSNKKDDALISRAFNGTGDGHTSPPTSTNPASTGTTGRTA